MTGVRQALPLMALFASSCIERLLPENQVAQMKLHFQPSDSAS